MANTVTPDGARIRSLRIRHGWTQEQLAGITGVSTRSIQRTERGSATSLETLRALASGFSIEVSDLLPVEAAVTVSPASPQRETAPERFAVPAGVVEPLPVRPSVECRDLPVRHLGVQLPSISEMAVLTMSIVALVAAIAFVGHGWSSRYTADVLALEVSMPAARSAAVPPDADRSQPKPTVQDEPSNTSPAGLPAQATQSLTGGTYTGHSPNGVTAPAPAQAIVVVEPPHVAAAWPGLAVKTPDTEGEAVLRAEARASFDASEMRFSGAAAPTMSVPPTGDAFNFGFFGMVLREAGRKTGGFLARSGGSIGTSIKAVF
jgi:transcriptional regulator with XRE-family HTH domain